jgi:RND family efflux transporter MFP subunit
MTRFARTCAAVSILALATSGGCSDPASRAETTMSAPQKEAPPDTSARGAGRIEVETARIEPAPFRDTLEIRGVIAPWNEVVVATELGGFVREVSFEKGDVVDEGDVLARIGDDVAAAQLDQAEADLLAAKANFEKTSKLFERQAVPQQDLVAATSRRNRAQAVVREMEIRLERSIVRAPIAGLALERDLEPGEVVAPGATVTTLQRQDRLKIDGFVPDTEVGWLSVGRDARFLVDAYPNRAFEARVIYLAGAAETATRTFEIELSITGEHANLRPGMVGKVLLVRRTLDDAIVAPVDALVTTQDGLIAFVVEECVAHERAIEIDGRESDVALVARGLEVGDELVVSGQRDLVDGQPVRSETCP